MRKSGRILLFAVVMPLLFAALAGVRPVWSAEAKNVIMMIPDGTAFEQYALARWHKGAPLATDEILSGAVKTFIADSVVADSAPTASAYATGVRTNDKFIGIAPRNGNLLPGVPPAAEGAEMAPLATVLEAARLEGKAVGVVATSRLSHATPASFVAHVEHRKLEDDIMEQAVYQNVDVVFGGGGRHLVGKEASGNAYGEKLGEDPHSSQWMEKGKRPDREDLIAVLKGRGYEFVSNREALQKVQGTKVFGMFALSHMTAEIDRAASAPGEPSLAEMTGKALDILAKDPEGFFLVVEGSQIDWANHANDPAHLISDSLAFDDAVAKALEFAKKDGNTLLLVMPDHNTGGLSIGNYATSNTYSQMKLDELLAPLKAMKGSSYAMAKAVGDDRTPARVVAVVKEVWGMDITDEDAAAIIAKMGEYEDDPNYAFGEVLSPKYTLLGWSTHGHTGGDVPLSSFGPGRPVGLFDGPEMATVAAEAMGLDLAAATKRLFAEAATALPDAAVSVDFSAEGNPVVKAERNGKTFTLPVNKNLLIEGDKVTELEGVVVHIPATGKAYIPQQAVDAIMAQ